MSTISRRLAQAEKVTEKVLEPEIARTLMQAWDFFSKVNAHVHEKQCEPGKCICLTDDQMAESVLVGYPEAR